MTEAATNFMLPVAICDTATSPLFLGVRPRCVAVTHGAEQQPQFCMENASEQAKNDVPWLNKHGASRPVTANYSGQKRPLHAGTDPQGVLSQTPHEPRSNVTKVWHATVMPSESIPCTAIMAMSGGSVEADLASHSNMCVAGEAHNSGTFDGKSKFKDDLDDLIAQEIRNKMQRHRSKRTKSMLSMQRSLAAGI
eukprot:366390-Chlamydomonas_euryale.AAC.22